MIDNDGKQRGGQESNEEAQDDAYIKPSITLRIPREITSDSRMLNLEARVCEVQAQIQSLKHTKWWTKYRNRWISLVVNRVTWLNGSRFVKQKNPSSGTY